MRFYELLQFQHVMLYIFPTLAFMVVFGAGLAYSRFRRNDDNDRMTRIISRHPDGIEERNAPFPLMLFLTIVGTIIWAVAYTVGIGLLGVRI